MQRSVLYALRALRPVDHSLRNLRPEAWQILRTILDTPSDGDAWVLQDMAGLLRDIARSAENLWALVHHVLRELPDSGLLPILGQTQPQMLDSRPLPRAIAALDGLHRATTPADAGAALAELATVFPTIDFFR